MSVNTDKTKTQRIARFHNLSSQVKFISILWSRDQIAHYNKMNEYKTQKETNN